MEFAACTIIAKNYLPMARVLTESWHRFHPGCPMFVLLLDSPQGFFRPEEETFQSVPLSELPIPNLPGFLFKYTVLEASTAAKPYLLAYLFRTYQISKLLYLDPDILILNALDGLRSALDEANVLLTPHLLSPLPADGRTQNDHDILQAGTYNLGFVGLRNSLETRRLLRWWCGKLYHHCLSAVEQNLFVDQRWMDLVPAIFDGVRILRDPGYNVAYWNLHERSVSLLERMTVNGGPLYFFHFSGFDPQKLWIVSKFQDRYDQNGTGAARKLYGRYRDLLLENGWSETQNWKYGNDFFTNGVRIPPSARQYYWRLGPDVAHLGNPFHWLDGSNGADVIQRFDIRQPRKLPAGVNVMGYFEAETGVGEGARSNRRIIQAIGLPYKINKWIDKGSQNLEPPPEELAKENPFLVNLITVNADQFVPFAKEHISYMKGHYNIGYWAWELSEFPKEWATSFGYVDEVWTPSKFTCTAVASSSPVPVRVVPHSLDLSAGREIKADRAAFDIPPDVFLFLFLFDFHSFLERKNPLGLIEAYRRAFGARKDVQLLIKSSHSAEHERELLLLQRAADGSNVRILDAVLTREDKEKLMMTADCYVSLHRSEGFGLTMAEAMLFGKPVIATAYSGNVDFMSDDDSFLVPYRMITIDQTHGPYKAGCQWADPDLDYACDLLRYVESHREAAAEVGRRAQARVSELLSPATIATSVRARLERLGLLGQPATAAVCLGTSQ